MSDGKMSAEELRQFRIAVADVRADPDNYYTVGPREWADQTARFLDMISTLQREADGLKSEVEYLRNVAKASQRDAEAAYGDEGESWEMIAQRAIDDRADAFAERDAAKREADGMREALKPLTDRIDLYGPRFDDAYTIPISLGYIRRIGAALNVSPQEASVEVSGRD